MKKTILMAAAVLCAALTSCNQDTTLDTEKTTQDIHFNISVADFGTTTRTIKQYWEAGDKLNVWFGYYDASPIPEEPDLILTYDGTKWNAGTLRSGLTVDQLEDNDECCCFYEGCNSLNTAGGYTFTDHGYAGGCFSRTTTLGDNTYSHFPMVLQGYSEYSFEDNTITTTLGSGSWIYLTAIQVVVTGLDKSQPGKYTLQVPQFYTPNAFYIYPDEVPSPTLGTTKNAAAAGVSNDDGVAFYFVSSNSTDTNRAYKFTLTDYTTDESNPTVKTCTLNGTINNNTANKRTKCTGIKIAADKFTAQ